MLILRKNLLCLALLSVIQLVKDEELRHNDSSGDSSGSGHMQPTINGSSTASNRSRKDYIIAVEENPSAGRDFDPVFQMLKGLAKRTRGQMAVMDYGGRYQKVGLDEDRDYEADSMDSPDSPDSPDSSDPPYEDSEEEPNFPFEGRQGLIGQNILANFLAKRFESDEDRPRERDNIRSFNNDDDMEDNNDNAPSVVYEMDNDEQDERPFPGEFGDRQSMFADNGDEDKKK